MDSSNTAAFAGLRTGSAAVDAADNVDLTVHGLPTNIICDARAAAFADGPDHLVPCGAERVDRFDGRLLLDDVSRWSKRGVRLQQQVLQDDVDGAALDAERYRYLDPSKEHLLQSVLASLQANASESDSEDGACCRWHAAGPLPPVLAGATSLCHAHTTCLYTNLCCCLYVMEVVMLF